MPQSASTKKQQSPKESQLLIDTERRKYEQVYCYKPYRTLHNYMS